MEKVSVIVPVYNAQQYLHKCIGSILSQTYRNLELILVNDGSTDNSLKICKEYAQKDNRVKVIDKENGGASSARNVGLQEASGSFCCFVDSDDWISKEYIKRLVEGLIDNNAQCAVASMVDVLLHKNVKQHFEQKTIVREDAQACRNFFSKPGAYGFAWGKLFQLETIRQEKITFDVNTPIFEDCIFTTTYLAAIEVIVTIPNAVYFYNHLTTGSLVSKYYDLEYIYRKRSIEALEKCLRHFLSNENIIRDILQDQAIRCIELTTSHYAVQHKTDGILQTFCEFSKYLYHTERTHAIFAMVKDFYYGDCSEESFYSKIKTQLYSPGWVRASILRSLGKLKSFYYFKIQTIFKGR